MLTPARWRMVEALTKLVAFRPHSGLTFCNEFLQAASFLWGCEDLAGKMIRQAHQWVHERGDLWAVLTAAEAQLAANQGDLVVAFWSDAAPGNDHGCLITPGKLEASGTWKADVPQCANVGRGNFYGKRLSFAFPADKKPQLYAWRPV